MVYNYSFSNLSVTSSQPKPIITNRVVKWLGKDGEYTIGQIKNNPDLLFLFGDNDRAKYRTDSSNPGGGGQASATRPKGNGELPFDRLSEDGGLNGNAVGITTTFRNGYIPSIDEFKFLMDKEFAPIEAWVKGGGCVVVPSDDQGKHNLGAGIAKLKDTIPGAVEYIRSKVDELIRLGQQSIQNSYSDDLKQELHKTLSEERRLFHSSKGLKGYLTTDQSLARQQTQQVINDQAQVPIDNKTTSNKQSKKTSTTKKVIYTIMIASPFIATEIYAVVTISAGVIEFNPIIAAGIFIGVSVLSVICFAVVKVCDKVNGKKDKDKNISTCTALKNVLTPECFRSGKAIVS